MSSEGDICCPAGVGTLWWLLRARAVVVSVWDRLVPASVGTHWWLLRARAVVELVGDRAIPALVGALLWRLRTRAVVELVGDSAIPAGVGTLLWLLRASTVCCHVGFRLIPAEVRALSALSFFFNVVTIRGNRDISIESPIPFFDCQTVFSMVVEVGEEEIIETVHRRVELGLRTYLTPPVSTDQLARAIFQFDNSLIVKPKVGSVVRVELEPPFTLC